jgi:hypothetical protein
MDLDPQRCAERFAIEYPEHHVHESVERIPSGVGQDALEIRLLRHGGGRGAGGCQEHDRTNDGCDPSAQLRSSMPNVGQPSFLNESGVSSVSVHWHELAGFGV